MQRFFVIAILVCLGSIATTQVMAQENTGLLGGGNTVFDTSEDAFTNPLPLLPEASMDLFNEGDELFEEEWRRGEGLGPIFNATSCESCHVSDGRGRPPAFTGETGTGLLIRLSINNADGTTSPDPVYGGQFQDDSIGRTGEEGTLSITYTELTGVYADGTPYTLYQPDYDLVNLNFGSIHGQTTLSPRLGNQMIGLGLLEAVDDSTLLALADPSDMDGDGISGRVNLVWDIQAQDYVIGRFGWKANQPTLLQQAAGAFNGDLGLTTTLFPDDACPGGNCINDDNRRGNPNRPPPLGRRSNDNRRNDNDNRQNNNPPPRGNNNGNRLDGDNNRIEVTDAELQAVTFYTQTLAVPAQRNTDDAQVVAGQILFETANCSSCHQPTLQTGFHDSIPALSNQSIQPYTDLLLHDMGAGLADGQVDNQASGTEWRTAPLWGIGLLEQVNGYAFYLHDGRARTLEEAILWHGGEAATSRDLFINMSAEERGALVTFLQSL